VSQLAGGGGAQHHQGASQFIINWGPEIYRSLKCKFESSNTIVDDIANQKSRKKIIVSKCYFFEHIFNFNYIGIRYV